MILDHALDLKLERLEGRELRMSRVRWAERCQAGRLKRRAAHCGGLRQSLPSANVIESRDEDDSLPLAALAESHPEASYGRYLFFYLFSFW